MRSRWNRLPLTAVAVALIVIAAGCSREQPLPPAGGRIYHEYVDPAYGEGSLRLRLLEDGRFDLIYTAHAPTLRDSIPRCIAEGTWERDVTKIRLEGDVWRAILVEGRSDVTIPGRSERLPCLTWLSGSENALVESCRFLSVPEFGEFLHPSAGSGGEGGGW